MSDKNLISNPTRRIALCIYIDNNSSMTEERMDSINKYLSLLYKKISSDELLAYSFDLCVVTGGETHIRCISQFSNVIDRKIPLVLATEGKSLICEGVSFSLDLISERLKEYKSCGVDFLGPKLLIISDGCCEYDTSLFSIVKSKMAKLVSSAGMKVLSVIPRKVPDSHLREDFLTAISPLISWNIVLDDSVCKSDTSQTYMFKEFFEWVSKSVSLLSHSVPGERGRLDSVDEWSSLT